MPQKYKPKQPTGREYVDRAKDLRKYTHLKTTNLPERWTDTCLSGLRKAAEDIEGCAAAANKVYIKHKEQMTYQEMAELINAYSQRIELLKQGLRTFTDFDRYFGYLMDHVDMLKAESTRIKRIITNIINAAEAEHPENIEIKLINRPEELHFTSIYGEEKTKLGLTAKQRDHWLKLRNDAQEEISKKLSKDINIKNSLIKQLNSFSTAG